VGHFKCLAPLPRDAFWNRQCLKEKLAGGENSAVGWSDCNGPDVAFRRDLSLDDVSRLEDLVLFREFIHVQAEQFARLVPDDIKFADDLQQFPCNGHRSRGGRRLTDRGRVARITERGLRQCDEHCGEHRLESLQPRRTRPTFFSTSVRSTTSPL